MIASATTPVSATARRAARCGAVRRAYRRAGPQEWLPLFSCERFLGENLIATFQTSKTPKRPSADAACSFFHTGARALGGRPRCPRRARARRWRRARVVPRRDIRLCSDDARVLHKDLAPTFWVPVELELFLCGRDARGRFTNHASRCGRSRWPVPTVPTVPSMPPDA